MLDRALTIMSVLCMFFIIVENSNVTAVIKQSSVFLFQKWCIMILAKQSLANEGHPLGLTECV